MTATARTNKQGQLRLDAKAIVLPRRQIGAAVGPGKSADSLLIKRLVGNRRQADAAGR